MSVIVPGIYARELGRGVLVADDYDFRIWLLWNQSRAGMKLPHLLTHLLCLDL